MAERKQKKRTWVQQPRQQDGKKQRFQEQEGFVGFQSLRHGQAILLTCEVGRERKASRELLAILERYLEELNQSKASDQEGEQHKTGGQSVRESLLKEVEGLKEKAAQGGKDVIVRIDTGCGGSGGVSVPEGCGLEPVATCIRVLEEAKAGQGQSRWSA